MISHACEDNTIFVTRRPFIRKPTTRFPASRMAGAQWRIQDFSGGAPTPDWGTNPLLPPTNEVWGKVILSHLFVILFTGGCYPSMHCRWYLSMPCSRGAVLSSMLCSGGPARRGLPGLGGAWSGGCLVWGVCSQGDAWWRPPDSHCCGQYASYWNAFLFGIFFGLRKGAMRITCIS